MAESVPVTDCKNLRRVFTKKPQNRDPATSHKRRVYAIDTETYNGNIFLIADSDGRFLDKITPKSCLDWLFCRKYEGSWCFFYHLGYDAEVILKLLGSELFKYKNTGRLKFSFENYTIEYHPNKCLKISKGHHSVIFYDIAQFYHAKLSDAYQNNIRKLPKEYLDIKSKRSQFSITFYKRNTRKIRDYCITDCKLTKELAEHWIKLFHDAFGFYPARWVSSGYLAEKVLINNGINFPKFDDVPYDVQEMAFSCYYGGRFEITKRGFIGTAYKYDINSAYPHSLTKIPDLTKGRWIKRKSIHKDAKLGFFRIIADIPDCKYIPPFPFRTNGIIIFPSGKFETYVTLHELKVADSKHYKILDSYQFIPNGKPVYPFEKFVHSMYDKRLELKKDGNPLQLPIKIILNSIYGKTGQKVNRIMGNLFNPVIFASITGMTRACLYDFVMQNDIENDVVSFATDSVCTTIPLDIDSERLGEFSLEEKADDVFVLQNGFYRFNGKWKQRGIGKLGSKEIEHLDTFEKDGKLYYRFKVLRSSRLRSSILQDCIPQIGKIREYVREVNLNADRKRLWLNQIQSVDSRTKNDSVPISLSHFYKETI
ncbi:type B DNA polymerase [Candidatus Nitrosopumilus koreensis AR1]|uniref:DNA-directed DNA polymerase n=1 Tax=Candidatus Nitrosopumilus koreensis AR1 TaxID=1229908 RepID=K0B3K3_9ARCH|nr:MULTISPECIES: DNA polymerase [Nitrosopumilus]AFS80673.1 type B DNA polymerase [Candidatus Nitrosopumilus koreensis AR1]